MDDNDNESAGPVPGDKQASTSQLTIHVPSVSACPPEAGSPYDRGWIGSCFCGWTGTVVVAADADTGPCLTEARLHRDEMKRVYPSGIQLPDPLPFSATPERWPSRRAAEEATGKESGPAAT
jgi:hypothetical protein